MLSKYGCNPSKSLSIWKYGVNPKSRYIRFKLIKRKSENWLTNVQFLKALFKWILKLIFKNVKFTKLFFPSLQNISSKVATSCKMIWLLKPVLLFIFKLSFTERISNRWRHHLWEWSTTLSLQWGEHLDQDKALVRLKHFLQRHPHTNKCPIIVDWWLVACHPEMRELGSVKWILLTSIPTYTNSRR